MIFKILSVYMYNKSNFALYNLFIIFFKPWDLKQIQHNTVVDHYIKMILIGMMLTHCINIYEPTTFNLVFCQYKLKVNPINFRHAKPLIISFPLPVNRSYYLSIPRIFYIIYSINTLSRPVETLVR